jgi:hypothetical protein
MLILHACALSALPTTSIVHWNVVQRTHMAYKTYIIHMTMYDQLPKKERNHPSNSSLHIILLTTHKITKIHFFIFFDIVALYINKYILPHI